MSERPECLICFQPYDINSAWKCRECGQTCHQYCIEQWYERSPTCPFCRHDILSSELIYLISPNNDVQALTRRISQASYRVIVTNYLGNLNNQSLTELLLFHFVYFITLFSIYIANNS